METVFVNRFNTEEPDFAELEEHYRLGKLQFNAVVLENIYTQIKLRDLLLALFEGAEISESLGRAWLAQIVIINSALVEVILRQGVRIFISRHPDLTPSSHDGYDVIDSLSYVDLITKADEYNLLKMDQEALHLIRKLRNNVHIDRMQRPLEELEIYDLQVVKVVCDILYELINSLIFTLAL